MPYPLLIFSQSVCLIKVVDTSSHTKGQTVQIQISWLQKPTDPDLHCLQRQGVSGFSRTRVNCLEALIIIFYICILLKQMSQNSTVSTIFRTGNHFSLSVSQKCVLIIDPKTKKIYFLITRFIINDRQNITEDVLVKK